ncbi:ATP-binding protein [Ectobacillus sp. sgz5001026]|uniref:sensor histidine kinase n=1 Tax=Ectobacillus sp. sgz5001026 TaxID=3242473 RepID=UPI0036D2EE2C
MIKSIYVKNVIYYFLVIIVSLFASFLLTSFLFQKQEVQRYEEQLLALGKNSVQLYQNLDADAFQDYVKSISFFQMVVYIYDQHGNIVLQSNTEPPEWTQKIVSDVVEGSVYRNVTSPRTEAVGIPFLHKNEHYALFIRPSFKERVNQTRDILLTALVTAFVVGIILIVLTTRFLIRPIVMMTHATRELAKGNFKVRLNITSKDEIGELATSFNFMVEELDKTEQMRKDFVANVSHEIQSPLTVIKGMSTALKDDLVDPSEVKRYLGVMEQESERLSNLTKQLLQLSVLEAKKTVLHTSQYRLDSQLRNQLAGMQPLWMEKQLKIQIDLPKLEIVADQNLMSQVWINLFSNSIKYNCPNGMITITGQEMQDELEIVIANTGNGIPAEDLPRIFERFYKVDKSHTRTTNSYGLGLALVKRIIILHNGNISAMSTIGEETTFFIRLPKHTS